MKRWNFKYPPFLRLISKFYFQWFEFINGLSFNRNNFYDLHIKFHELSPYQISKLYHLSFEFFDNTNFTLYFIFSKLLKSVGMRFPEYRIEQRLSVYPSIYQISQCLLMSLEFCVVDSIFSNFGLYCTMSPTSSVYPKTFSPLNTFIFITRATEVS